MIPDRISGKAILLLISISLCVSMYYNIRISGPITKDTAYTYYADAFGDAFYQKLPQEWRPRLFSIWAAGFFFPLKHPGEFHEVDPQAFNRSAGLWVAFWLLATYWVFIALAGDQALLFMLATFVAVVSAHFGLGSENGHRPWDMPILFFTTLACFIAVTDKAYFLCLILPLAMGFKETALPFTLLFLLPEGYSFRKRMIMGLLVGCACVGVKIWIDIHTHNPSVFFSMTASDDVLAGEPRWLWNLRYIYSTRFSFLLTFNILVILLFFAMPMTRRLLVLKGLVVVLALGLVIFGMVNELRIWFEVLPPIFLGFHIWQGMKKDRA